MMLFVCEAQSKTREQQQRNKDTLDTIRRARQSKARQSKGG